MFYGIKTGLNEAFEVSLDQRAALVKKSPRTAALIKRFLGGQDIRRYSTTKINRYLIVIPSGWTRRQVGNLKKVPVSISEREAWKWFSLNTRI